ncbi:MAG TPA: hypothetical protein PKM88_04100, partial [bacterium]|nr:hypothetical protein [bacterium]
MKATIRELRGFGLGLGGILLVLAVLMCWRGMAHDGSRWRYGVAVAAGSGALLFLTAGAVAPAVLGPVYRWWLPRA